ncbi:MAG: chemotaxis protein MotB [Dethiobacter sp.]|jgi:chemotaxis protein MotB|nr:MAG: chemotaxis protein MotB [Dethiobacter sp.]
MRIKSSRRKNKNVVVEEGAPAWMVTYSDMITLVLAFFVLLFSFAAIDEARFNELLSSLRVTFLGSEGILKGFPDPSDSQDSFFDRDKLEDYQDTVEKIRGFIEEKGLEGSVNLLRDERGIVLEIPDVLFFDPKKAELKPEAQEILGYVADLLSSLDKQVIVEGHTDNVPINTYLFPSNWELSVARAVVVVRYLVEIKQLHPARFAAMGFGEFHPVATNLTSEGRARNRRVNIIISTPQYNL